MNEIKGKDWRRLLQTMGPADFLGCMWFALLIVNRERNLLFYNHWKFPHRQAEIFNATQRNLAVSSHRLWAIKCCEPLSKPQRQGLTSLGNVILKHHLEQIATRFKPLWPSVTGMSRVPLGTGNPHCFECKKFLNLRCAQIFSPFKKKTYPQIKVHVQGYDLCGA